MKLLSTVVKKHPLPILIGVAIAACLIGINEKGYQDSQRLLATQDQLLNLQSTTTQLSNTLQSAELSHRDYLLVSDNKFLQQFQAEASLVNEGLTAFMQQQNSMGINQSSAAQIEELIHARIQDMQSAVQTKQQGVAQNTSYNNYLESSHLSVADIVERLSNTRAATRAIADNNQKHIRDALSLSRLGMLITVMLAFVAFLIHMRQRLQLQLRTESYAHELQQERNHLEQQVIARTASLRELATNLQMTSEQTRSRLARELHDELGSLLTATKLHIARIKSKVAPTDRAVLDQVQSLNDTLNQVISIKRRIIEDLRPSSLDNFGLVTSLDILQAEFHERTGILVEAHLQQVELPSHGQLALYRIVQESLNNVAKYAQAEHVQLFLESHPHHIELRITDDGIGFDQSVIKPKSHGLPGMRHRVESLRGRLEVSSAPGKGTTIRAVVPQIDAETLMPDLDD